ncbi:MAG: hypothetical protein NTU63_03890 [Candidatus Pacearchaeota archaeon]|nr:hypothetical protein [Candidatus Pacearchaeota archaeon]
MSRLDILTKRNDFSDLSSKDIYLQLRELPLETREELQEILENVSLIKYFDRYRIHDRDDMD